MGVIYIIFAGLWFFMGIKGFFDDEISKVSYFCACLIVAIHFIEWAIKFL